MISLLLVNYRSAPLAADAARSARTTASEPLQVVIVDNSCEASEVEALRPWADHLIVAERNLGYAAAINRGRPHCSGDVLLVANPDVIFFAGALDALAATVRGGAAVAGPALYWDDAQQWILPPSDLNRFPEKLDQAVATRLDAWRERRDRRRIRQRLRFWSLQVPTAVDALSGAVMAIAASAFDAVSGFDERFGLYFEENDFLRRQARRGGRIVYVPHARCRHLYNQSAGTSGSRAAELYAASEGQYLAKWNGELATRAVKWLERAQPESAAVLHDGPVAAAGGQLVEASPLPRFETAAGHFATLAGEVDVPPEVWDAYRSPVLYLRVIDAANARVLATSARYRS